MEKKIPPDAEPLGTLDLTASAAPYAEAIRFLQRVRRRHHACVEQRISELGIHHSQHRMLMELARTDRIPSQKELAEHMSISPAAVTNTLKRLEAEGYISRSATDHDNRCNEIILTEKGIAKNRECLAIVSLIDRSLFAGMTEEELRVLSGVIRRMDENLDKLNAPDPCCRKRGD